MKIYDKEAKASIKSYITAIEHLIIGYIIGYGNRYFTIFVIIYL